ncbi:hypothetical protein ElyMa_006240300 [Elysia marginata]|uniref:Uncharacterized protein n=1 Tax=Elysia marginata TaxID=1093978 RepID=A0AAV4H988_9GAST|nr:hypothetical protein ElyMa_006240300 [Elysia marginata]
MAGIFVYIHQITTPPPRPLSPDKGNVLSFTVRVRRGNVNSWLVPARSSPHGKPELRLQTSQPGIRESTTRLGQRKEIPVPKNHGATLVDLNNSAMTLSPGQKRSILLIDSSEMRRSLLRMSS